jgi:hypothetical protein
MRRAAKIDASQPEIVKDGSKSLSRRNLTPDQSAWHANWRGSVVIVETVEQAVWLLNQV